MKRVCRTFVWTALIVFWPASAQAVTLGRAPVSERVSERQRSLPKPAAASPDDSRYEKIHELFLKSDYAGTERSAGAYLADSRAAKPDDVLYLQALSLIKLGRGSEAREKLRRLERSAYTEEQQAAAAVSTADSYYQEGIYTSAYESYKYALEKFPASGEPAYVRERIAGSAARMNLLDGTHARTVLQQRSIEESSKQKR